jgi:PAS domain S-box-containing protein
MTRSGRLALVRVVAPYAALATLWILASDFALMQFVPDAAALARWSMYKGVAFVVITAALLAYLVRRELLVHERDRATLTDSESRYRQLFEANPHPMWVYDAETTRFLAVNDAAIAQYGWSREEFLRMSIADIRPPEDVPRLRERLAELASGMPYARSGVWRHRRKDGALIEVEIISHALEFDGRPARLVVALDVTARVQAERAVRESEARHRAIFENPHAPMLVIDPEDGRIVDANAAAARFYGLSREQLLERSGADLNTLTEAEHRAALAAAASQRQSVFHFRHRVAGGEVRDVDVYSGPIERDGRTLLLSVVHDETARHRAERALQRMNRLYAMLSQTNQLVVRATDRTALLEGVCRIAVDHGCFKLAWVGVVRADGAIEPVARAGADDGYVDAVRAVVDPTHERGRGAAARAIASGKRVVIADVLADPDMRPWHAAASRAGIAAKVSLPLRESGEVIGALNLYAAERDAFGEPELRTLDEMASDISFGLDNLRRIDALHAALHVIEASPVVLFCWRPEPDCPVEFVSNNVARWGYPAESFVKGGRAYKSIVHPDDRARIQAEIEQHLAAGRDQYVQIYRIVTAAGEIRWVEDTTSVERAPSGEPIHLEGAVADITERHMAEAALRTSERRLREAQRQARIGSWRFVPPDTLDWSDQMYELFQLPRDVPLTYDAVVARLHPDDREAAHRAFHEAMASGATDHDAQYRVVWPDGQIRVHHSIGKFVRDAQGRLIEVVGTEQDITERKRAEQALADSERRFRATFEQAAVGMAHVAPDGRWLLVNDRLCEIVGYTRAELLARTFQDITHPDDLGRDLDQVRRLLAGEIGSYTLEKRYLRKDGSVVWINLTVALVRRGDGSPDYFVSVIEDISERKRAEILLRDTEERFHQLADNVNEVFWVSNPEKTAMLYVSSAYESIWGRSRDRLYESPHDWFDAVHPDDRDRLYTAFTTKQAVGEYDEIYRIVRPDGAVRWIHDRAYPVRDAHGGVYRIVGTASDITDRKRIEDELRMLSLAIEQSAESIVITDLNAQIEYVNAAFTRVSGYTREEVIGRNPRLLKSGRTPPATYEELWRTLLSGDVWRGEFINRRKDGAEYFEDAVISPIRQADGRIVKYLAVKEDVTDKRRVAVELEQYRHRLEELVAERTRQLEDARLQADAANQAKSAFLATMSHEIRTPMNGVLGMLEVLARSRLSEQQLDMVRTAEESGRTLLGIIDDILDFSKIEAGRLEIERAPVSIAEIVENLCDSMVPLANRRDVTLTAYVAPDIPDPVLADPLRLRQILFNLIGNAIKFSVGRPDRRGRVAVRVTLANRAPLQLAFEVADNGIGMTPEAVSRLFVPFTQAEVSTTRRFGGTGLGLTICKRLAELMHGGIAVASRPGEGSTFTLTVPVEPAERVGSAPRHLPDLNGVDCLVVASDEFDGDGVSSYLAHAGARVQRFASDADAARAAAQLPAPVVVIHSAVGPAAPRAAPGFRALAHVRHVWITRGRRRRARMESADAVTLDGPALRRHALLRAVAIAAGRASPETTHEDDAHAVAALPPPSVAEARDRGELILVAEDDEVSATVLQKQLALLGRTAEFAKDGAEALQRWRQGRYALLLTDLHMPVMDGYELAAAIRAEEAATGRPHRLPIVALTANALRGEAENARAAGMDDYLTKPLQVEQLRKALDQWLRAPAAASTGTDPAPSDAAVAFFDVAVLKAYVGDDPATLRIVLTEFLRVAPQQMAEIEGATPGDPARAGAAAHKLKSSARAVGALALGERCAELERTAKAGDTDELARSVRAVVLAWGPTRRAIEAALAAG